MTAKLDGTNGLLQQYDFQTPTTGFSYTFAAGVNVLVMNPAGTLATGTITMPASPVDGMTITVESTQQITALTVQGNTGQSLVNGTQTLRPNQPYSWVYRLSNTTWYPFAGATNSQLVSGVSQNSTSGTSIDFTGIPSWVKRITVMFAGVSTSGVSNIQIQIGAGAVETSGYLGASAVISSGGNGFANYTAGFGVFTNAATSVITGAMRISLFGSNKWVADASFGYENTGAIVTSGGQKTTSGTLDRLRITTVNGTDTFDAGTINILYE